MKQSVAHLNPYIEALKSSSNTSSRGKILMATVKGDVHDIGKNIVGVVLGCNNYDIIDMGVMVPASEILKKAKEENVDIIGLSGLITPSLDEMVFVAKEMERLGMKIPLMIGGATTSKTHTAVKVEPQYSGPVIHVLDASRSVAVASSLLTEDKKANKEFRDNVTAEYDALRKARGDRKSSKKYISIEKARDNRVKIDWSDYTPPVPKQLGLKELKDYSLEEIAKYIDWTPFFTSWQLRGKYPAILEDEVVGVESKKLFNDAQSMLRRIIDEKWLTANAVFGLFPANSVDHDTIEVYKDDTRKEVMTSLFSLRQQRQKAPGQPNYSLTDFIAPKSSNKKDYMGAFAVTTGIGIEKWVKKFEKDLDDYSAIMLKALADRLAEAFTELLHERVRKEFWGYDANEKLTNDDLISEKYNGIRPAPGYPACPEHTEKAKLFEMIDAEKLTGIKLTESFAMYPAAAVSGWYFAHPQSKYFGLGNIEKDQVKDYAAKKDMEIKVAEKWLSPVLNYDI